MNNVEFRISQYADDTSIILDGSESSHNHTISELERFSGILNLKKLNKYGLAQRNTVQTQLKQNGNCPGVKAHSKY